MSTNTLIDRMSFASLSELLFQNHWFIVRIKNLVTCVQTRRTHRAKWPFFLLLFNSKENFLKLKFSGNTPREGGPRIVW